MPSDSETILALDLATKCGYAVLKGRRRIESGRVTLYTGRRKVDVHRAVRWLNFRRFVRKMLDTHPIDVVAYESVRRHVGTTAAHVYGGLLAQVEELELECMMAAHGGEEESKHIEFVRVEVGAWKKATVGNGSALKADVQRWVKHRFRYTPKTEDEADALAIAEAVRRIRRKEYP